ncbi:MAG: hypothetical protein ACRERD_30465, partial [Candidatus Binatia bacterium]
EYEIVKGDQSYEVRLDMAENLNRALSVDVSPNLWRTEAPERVLQWNERRMAVEDTDYYGDRPERTAVRDDELGDRDRKRIHKMVHQLESLPIWRSRRFYRLALQQRGYQITGIDTRGDRVQFEAVKNGRGVTVGVALNVDFDEDTGRSTDVNAVPLWWEPAQTRSERGTGMSEVQQVSRNGRDWMLEDESARDDMRASGRRFSDRERVRVEQMIEELASLPVGQGRQFYRRALRERGYEIPAVYINTENQLQFEAVKNGRRAVVTVNFFDDETGQSTAVYASPLDSTRRVSQSSGAVQEPADTEDNTRDRTDETEHQVKTE